jgi:hypothetical protein
MVLLPPKTSFSGNAEKFRCLTVPLTDPPQLAGFLDLQ